MKLLHVVQCYDPVVGGSEWLVKNLSEQFTSRYGDDVTVFTAAATKPAYFWRAEGEAMPPGVECVNGVTVRRFKVFRGLRLWRMLWAHTWHRLRLPYHDWARTIQLGPLIFDMPEAIASSGADLVFATAFPFMHMYYAVAGARRAGMPVVLLGAIHTADKWGYDRKMMYDAIQKADAYIAHTTFEKEHLVARGISAGKISVIGGGVDPVPFMEAEGVTTRVKYGWGDDFVVAVMSRQSILKRLDTVLKAMPKVWEVNRNVRLLMAGARTAYSAQLDKMISTMSAENQARITVVNDFPEADKPDLLAASDLLVYPSGNESFGLAFVEAWAAGKPVAGARIAAVPAVINEGRDGCLFNYGDPDDLARVILQLVTNPQRGVQMGQKGRQKVLSNFTWESVSDRLRDVYVEAISRKRQPPVH
jgi:glycosyltransferase involved in cell wall biosynthesis